MKAVLANSSNGLHFSHLRCDLCHLVARTPCDSFNIHKKSGIPLGTWNERPLPLCAQAPSISLINPHLQPVMGAFKSVRPCLHFHRLPQQNQCYRSGRS
ncbi:hypothetical protein CDAR_602501 [Caerostris darwini]|uniref:Uncharacterized protein n=1 Tax=Caerostris darwini TaxID=1538125 RepID=A0AAV4TP21_9ARAC|nr:hypothetical protein CDAR_602501 [Caerostris darwini]